MVARRREQAKADGTELSESFELLHNGQPRQRERKLNSEEIDLIVRRVSRIVKIGMFMDRYPQ